VGERLELLSVGAWEHGVPLRSTAL